MALHAMWVHGNAVRPEWVGENFERVIGGRWDETAGEVPFSELNGLPRGWGTTFRGKASLAEKTPGIAGDELKEYWFHFSIPAPVMLDGRRVHLRRVSVLWHCGEDVSPAGLHVYDGGRRIAEFGMAAEESGRDGLGGIADLVPGVTAFELANARPINWGVGISIAFRFRAVGDVTFFSAGADFES